MGKMQAGTRFVALVVFALVLMGAWPRLANAQTEEMLALEKQTAELFQAGHPAEALAAAERLTGVAEGHETAKGQPGQFTVSALTSVSWYALFAGQPEKALAASERALTIEPGNLIPALNRGHALLFLGRIGDARAVYVAHKGEFDERIDEWEKAIGKDFAEFRQRGLAHPEIADMEKALAAASDSPKGVIFKRNAQEIGRLVNQRQQIRATGNFGEMITQARREAALSEETYGPASLLTAGSIAHLGQSLQAAAQYGEAEAVFKRVTGILEKYRVQRYRRQRDLSLALVSINLATVYRMENRPAEAEPLLLRAIAMQENSQESGEVNNVRLALAELGRVYAAQNIYREADLAFRRALEMADRQNGPGDMSAGAVLADLAELYQKLGRHDYAEALLTQAIAQYENGAGVSFFKRLPGAPHPFLDPMLNQLAQVYLAQGRYTEAEPLLKRALDLAGKNPDKINEARVLNNLGTVHTRQGRYAEAEPLLRRSLDILEKLPGTDQAVAPAINNLAAIYDSQGRLADAEALYKRSLAIREERLGPDHPDVALALNNLATLYYTQQRYSDAEPLFRRALAIHEKTPGASPAAATTGLVNLAELFSAQGRLAEAEPLYQRALAIREKELGPDHADAAESLHNLASFYLTQGRYAEALPVFKRSLAIWEKALGADHPRVATSLNNVAELHFKLQDWAQAASYWQRSSDILTRRFRRGGQTAAASPAGNNRSEVEQESSRFSRLVKVSHRLTTASPAEAPQIAARMFEAAQWAQGSAAAQSLAQMAARRAKGASPLAQFVRERQDLAAEWQVKDKLLITARSQAANQRNPQADDELHLRLSAIDARLADIDKMLAKDFPDYAAFASPEPLTLTEAQGYLKDNEALLLFLDTPEKAPLPEETFIWVVTKTASRWVRAPLGTPALRREVQALRCGLDFDGAWGEGSACPELLGFTYTQADYNAGKPLPFDPDRAHALYRVLFGQIEDMIRGKRLLIAASGPLSQLPFQVLVTEAPEIKREDQPPMRQVQWLARRHSLTVLPAVSSLKALRRDARASRGGKPYLGIGNPLLDGGGPSQAERAKEAREKQSCPKRPAPPARKIFDLHRGAGQIFMQGGHVDVTRVRSQAPLPETADELCAVADVLKADSGSVLLGGKASETAVKGLSDQGALAGFRVVHFATHGALAGQISAGSDPGLLLTPPQTASDLDDGYLSASEIINLKLDADWVILSACNTAAGGTDNTEALSGLARSFFYAGARSMLVSHWPVESGATVKLVTNALSAITADASMGRAEAMQRAMLALIDTGAPEEAHPAYWAPFVVSGEGAR